MKTKVSICGSEPFSALPPWFLASLALQMLLIVSEVRAVESSMWEANAEKLVPAGAKVTLEVDRREYFLGENVFVHFILENTGDQPFEADFGVLPEFPGDFLLSQSRQ